MPALYHTKGKSVAPIASAVAVGVMCVFVFVMSALPADDSTMLSTGVISHIVGFIVPGYDRMSPADQLYWQEALQHPVRKAAHFSEYALLGALSLNLVMRIGVFEGRTRTLQAAVAWTFCTVYAATDEFHQLFVPGRDGAFTDVCIDSCGSLAGIAVFAALAWACDSLRRHATNAR